MATLEKLKNIAEKFSKMKNKIETEESTKNALILPFLQML